MTVARILMLSSWLLSVGFAMLALHTAEPTLVQTSHARTTYSGAVGSRIKKAPSKQPVRPETARDHFETGTGAPDPEKLLSQKVFVSYPLKGSVRKRAKQVSFIVLHSTETEKPADAKRIIRSWNNRGKNHPGTQYVVDRDGTIYQTANPRLVTIHVNIHRTRFGVDNHNSVGIETVRSGSQKYTEPQLRSLSRLTVYLRNYFGLTDKQIVTHGYIQPSTRTDPVNFDLNGFRRRCRSISQPHTNIAIDSPRGAQNTDS